MEKTFWCDHCQQYMTFLWGGTFWYCSKCGHAHYDYSRN